MGAEAAVAHADGVLGAQDRGQQRVAVALELEGRQRRHGRRSRRATARAAAAPARRASPAARRADEAHARAPATASHTELAEDPARRPERDRAHDVRRAGLVALGRIGPHDVVERDELDRPAAAQQRLAALEGATAGDERAGPERRVELVPRQREVVDARARHVDGAMRRELGGVDEELGAVVVRDRGELGQRPHLAGDVRGARDGDEVDARLRRRAARARSAPRAPTRCPGPAARSGRGDATAACSRDARPRVESTRVPAGSAAARTLMASVVLRTSTTVPSRAPDELGHRPAGALVRRGRQARLVAAAAVHAAAPGHELLDGGPHAGHRRRARRVVQVDVAPRAPVEARHLDVGPDHGRALGQRLLHHSPPDSSLSIMGT